MADRTPPLKLAIGGLGAIGLAVARRIDAGDVPGIDFAAAVVRDQDKARRTLAGFRRAPQFLDFAGAADAADVIVECLPSAQFAAIATRPSSAAASSCRCRSAR